MSERGCSSRAGVDRRTFLKSLGTVAVATLLGRIELDAYGAPSVARALPSAIADQTLPGGTPICVLVTLDGGNDGLNTLVPVNDVWYYDAEYGHGALALQPDSTLPLTGTGYGIHPNLPWVADRWNTVGDVAFVQGVGERDLRNFSHFDSMKYWQTADTTLLEPRGWLGRYNDLAHPGNSAASISLSGLRLECIGQTSPALVVRDTAEFHLALPWYETTSFRAGLDLMATAHGGGFRGRAADLFSTFFQVSTRIEAASDPTITAGEHSRIAQQLLQAALLIRAGLPCQTYAAAYGPFDSHSNQLTMQGDRFTELNEALSLFFAALDGTSRRDDVFVMIVSEFGRQLTSNASVGTDHGQSGLAILVGGGVTRGLYGQAPTLDPGGPTRPNRIHDALRPIVDFRSLHATVLTRLARDAGGVAQAVLRGVYEDLRVFSATGAVDRPSITAPVSGSPLARGASVTVSWTAVPGAVQYGFEFTGVNRQFANPNDVAPDSVNGYGGAGGAFLVSGTGLTAVLPPDAPPGSYQIRVIGLTAGGQLVGRFSDAVTLVIQ